MGDVVNGVHVDEAIRLARKFLPHLNNTQTAIPAPGFGGGFWVGACSAIEYDGYIYLAYRLRHPVSLGRGQGVVIARSRDGVNFETIAKVSKDAMDAESLERPTLVRTPEGVWRLYLSCATTGTKHWRVEVIEADDPEKFDPATHKVVLPGDKDWGVKDTVIVYRESMWHLWATFHPLDVPNQEDRMESRYATSKDGLSWTWATGVALSPRKEGWDNRGARITAVFFAANFILAFYDGRASAAENYEERTGIAVGTSPAKFEAIGDEPYAQSPNGRGLRYLDIVPLAHGNYRTYFEISTPDDSHELRTERVVLP